jgi:phosphatidylserine decarboxylase
MEEDVRPFQDKPLKWLSDYHFFRDPSRPTYSDLSYFFAPADGIILYQKVVGPSDPIVDLKGKSYSLQDALRDPGYDKPSLVIGTFMTFFDVHINRIPYPGRLSYKLLDPIESYNRPMLDVEEGILEDLRISPEACTYLHVNQRMVNRIDAVDLRMAYYVLQIADYDVDCIIPFDLKQNQAFDQGERFSQIRYGSQVDLILPLSPRFEFTPTQPEGVHVEGGVDTLVAVRPRSPRNGGR